MKEKVTGFHIEESVQNEGRFILIATTETGKQFVVAGDPSFATYLEKYDGNFYTDPAQKVK